jgi:hypothetical protein
MKRGVYITVYEVCPAEIWLNQVYGKWFSFGKYIYAFKYIHLYYVGGNFRLTKLYLEIELERFYLLKAIDEGLGSE